MNFDKHQVEKYFLQIKQEQAFPNSYIPEIFLIGKLTEDNNLKVEISSILTDFCSKDTVQAFNSRTKIPNTGKSTDYHKTLEALISFGKKATELDIGKMFSLLGYDSLTITNSTLIKKVNDNLWFFSRLNNLKQFFIKKETFPLGLPEEIGELNDLEELDIRGDFKTLPSAISKLVKLKKLSLETSSLTEIPESFQNLKQLEELKITGEGRSGREFNEQLQIPKWISGLDSLKKLTIGYLKVNPIPDDIFPSKLESLRIYRMHEITHLPEKISELSSLKHFELHVCNQLVSLPKDMNKLTNLETFKIGSLPKLNSLDGNLVFSPKLKKISLIEGIEITEPDRKTNHIKELIINNISYLNYIIDNPELFPDLETLEINELKEFNTSKGVNNLVNLKKISIRQSSDIPELFNNITSCPNLKTIHLNNSELTSLPDIRSLEKLSHFKVHHCNQLSLNTDQLPVEINLFEISNANEFTFGNVTTKYTSTTLHNTHIQNFEAIGKVLDTQRLDLYFSDKDMIDGKLEIKKLPDSIGEMKNLVEFSFNGKISKINNCFNSLDKLKSLELGGLQTTSGSNYPIEHIEPLQLPQLSTIKISNYLGTNLEDILKKLKSVTSLELKYINNYDELPISELKDLEQIKLYSCGFSDLTKACSTIKSFDAYFCEKIGDNAIKTICTWKELSELHLKYIDKEVEYLPECLAHLKLSILNLNHINLKEIPDFLGKIDSLKVLYLDGFYLNNLPSSIAQLPQLEFLSLDLTLIKNKLSDEFKNLKLKEIRMFRSKFSGNNMKLEIYEHLITPTITKIVREFSSDSFSKN